jgi:hypothetical protein
MAYPLQSLISILKQNGYSDSEFQDLNNALDLPLHINIPEHWKDPASPADAPRASIPDDCKGLAAVAVLVGNTGYRLIQTG